LHRRVGQFGGRGLDIDPLRFVIRTGRIPRVFIVTNMIESGAGSLRLTITNANATANAIIAGTRSASTTRPPETGIS